MRKAGQLEIGPLRFRLETAAGLEVRYSDPAYAGFYAAGESRRPADLELPVVIRRGARTVPAGEPLWRGGRNWAAWADGPELVICAGFHGRERARWCGRVARDLSRAELDVDFDGDVCEAPLRYPLDQILAWGLLSRIGGALLHSAAAVKDGRGLVLAGRSGAGKSTLAELCRAAGWRILNDDRALVYRRGGSWTVAGTPWHGSGRFAEAAEAPLGGILFLRQASANRRETMPAATARLALLDVAAVPWFEDDWAQGTLDGLDRLAREVETGGFHFTKAPEAVATLEGVQEFQRSGACA